MIPLDSLKPHALWVLNQIILRGGKRHDVHLQVRDVAGVLGIHERSVYRALRTLRTAGVIKCRPRAPRLGTRIARLRLVNTDTDKEPAKAT